MKKPRDAHYYNEGDKSYFKVHYDVVYEWRVNHWEPSSIDLHGLDLLISLNSAKPLFFGLLASTLATLAQLALLVASVGALIWFIK